MKIRQVEIAKRKYAVSFNMAAWHDIEKETGMSPSSVFDENKIDPSNMMRLMYLGLKYGADAAGHRFNMTYSAFVELIDGDEAGGEVLGKMVGEDVVEIINIQNERYRLANPDAPEVEDKKKAEIPSGATTSDVSEA